MCRGREHRWAQGKVERAQGEVGYQLRWRGHRSAQDKVLRAQVDPTAGWAQYKVEREQRVQKKGGHNVRCREQMIAQGGLRIH